MKMSIAQTCMAILIFISFCLTVSRASAEIRLPRALSDHAVLQRGVPISIWGWATPGAKLTVGLHDQHVAGEADRLGEWRVWLSPEVAGGPFVLTVTGEGSEGTRTISDLLVGDVWLASGQSNMDIPLNGYPGAPVRNGQAEIKAATHPRLRLLHISDKSSSYPQRDVGETWTTCTPETAADFSAVAYFFGREISEREGVPVGLIVAAWGGVPVDSFMSLEALTANSTMLPALANRAQFQNELAAYDTIAEAEKREDDTARAQGKPAPHHDWRPDGASWLPSGPYNSMISPLKQYSIKGFLWYQGETDTRAERAPYYLDLFSALIFDWRRQFAQGNLPFLYVQLSSFRGDGGWGVVRDAQRRTLALSDTAMAVSLDVGEKDNIHPADKQTIAARLALAARNMVYNEPIPYRGPLFREATNESGAMRVWFDHAEGLTTRGEKLEGFEVAGADRHFVPADASIDNTFVLVKSGQIADPRYVRYDWNGIAPPSLYNAAGLPASTFSSESFPRLN